MCYCGDGYEYQQGPEITPAGCSPALCCAVAPPHSNTGAQNTKTLIDALSFTLLSEDQYSDAFWLLGSDGWEKIDFPKRGYKTCEKRGNLYKWSDGKQGIHVSGMGQACRELEASGLVSSWPDFLQAVLRCKGKFTRLDVAVDDYCGYLSLPRMVEDARSGYIRSYFKKGTIYEGFNISDGKSTGTTIYIGQPSSDVQVRIYDKAKQMDVECPWVRVELEFKGSRAHKTAEFAAFNTDLVYLQEILYQLVDFVEPNGHDVNKSRWPTAPYWSTFLDVIKKMRLATEPKERVCEDVEAWLDKQIAPSLAMLIQANGGDYAVIDRLINSGSRRLNNSHLSIINEAQARYTKQ